MAKQKTILLATAQPAAHQPFIEWFDRASDWRCLLAGSGEEAMQTIRAQESSLLLFLLDAALADEDGLGCIQYLHRTDTIDCVPTVLIMPQGRALSDFVPTNLFISEVIEYPADPVIITRRLRRLVELHDYHVRDLSYHHAVSRDPLLGLFDRHSFPRETDRCLSEHSDTMGVLAFLNVDNMRAINERHGHHFGDLVLIDVARTLQAMLPQDAVVARLQGDTFAAYVPDILVPLDGIRLLEALKTALNRTYADAPGGPQRVSACIGAALYPEHAQDACGLLEAAEVAASVAKRIGRNVLIFYSQALHAQHVSLQPSETLPDITQELAPHEWFTPILSGNSDTIIGYDYIITATSDPSEAYQEIIRRITTMPAPSMIHQLRMDVKRFFGRLYDMTCAGISLPKFSFYTVLRGEQAEMLPQILQETLQENPFDPSRVCINIAQQMVLEMSRSRLETLARDIRAIGFSFGVHNVGNAYFANACFIENVFDRILFSHELYSDLVCGVYPPAFLRQILGYFIKMDAVLCFPVIMTRPSRRYLTQMIGNHYGSYGQMLSGQEAFLAHYRATTPRVIARHAPRETFSFRMTDERFGEVFTKCGIIILDWRPYDDTVALSDSFYTMYEQPRADAHLSDLIDDIIHPDDLPRVKDLLLQVKHGGPNVEGLYRARRKNGSEDEYRWRRFFLIAVPQHDGMIAHVYAVSFDVDRERREMQDVIKKAEIDPLTQVYNRGATQAHIQEYLRGDGKEGQHALFIIDLDDFKHLNDGFGHQIGDHALEYIAAQMRGLFRQGDIIGRIGGDEFMVFLKNIQSTKRIAERAQDICDAAQKAPPEWSLGTTVGIARYPQHGDTFETLYAKADAAMYQAKKMGKGRWAFYEEPTS